MKTIYVNVSKWSTTESESFQKSAFTLFSQSGRKTSTVRFGEVPRAGETDNLSSSPSTTTNQCSRQDKANVAFEN